MSVCVSHTHVGFVYGYVEAFLLKFKDDYVLNGAFKMVRSSGRGEGIIIIKEKAY